MIHLVLTLCRKFETAFAKLIDGGKGGASFSRHCLPGSRSCRNSSTDGRSCLLIPPSLPVPLLLAGGELILTVFEKRLPDSIEKQPFKKILEVRAWGLGRRARCGVQPNAVG